MSTPSVTGSSAQPRISVILPVLDEELRLGDQLDALADVPGIHEVIVVDGGSRDRTLAIAWSRSGVVAVTAPRGRGAQMNVGADLAVGDVLLFLHADTRLPVDAAGWVGDALAEPSVVAGAFRTWTVADGSANASWLGPLLHLADLRSRYSSLPYGDQAVFVRTGVFRRLGGFASEPLMEDLELARRLRRMGRIRTVPARVRVSGRRFLARPAYYTVLVNLFPVLYRLGIRPAVLARFYGNAR